ncbi:MAG: endo-1,4-beta-xylanase, partial [Bacteroides sp.]|nr:endo-1,4-beta-xylanase [Bacteroides sp.]
MKIHLLTIMIVISCCTTSCKTGQISISDLSLKERLSNKFLIGVALNAAHTSGRDTSAVKLINRHFNSIVAENCMKSEVIHPEENRYDFTH